jgi:hypothetical protein
VHIRRALPEDVSLIAPCARLFCETLQWPLNEENFLAGIRAYVESGNGAVFLLMSDAGEVAGGIGGGINTEPMSGRTIAVESFWYVRKEHRVGTGPMRLVMLFQKWAKEKGATHCCMLAMAKSNPDEMDRLYRRMGYEKLETTYILTLR